MLHRLFTVPMMLSMAGVLSVPEHGRAPATAPAGVGTVLRLARSKDGLVFRDSGELALAHISSPSAVLLSSGRLFAVGYRFPGTSSFMGERVAVHSEDSGKTWSDPQVVRILSRQGYPIPFQDCALARGPDGKARLYLVGAGPWATSRPAQTQPASRPVPAPAVYSAGTRDGVEFKVDGAIMLVPAPSGTVTLATAASVTGVDLFVWASGDNGKHRGFWRLVSEDGRHLKLQDQPARQGCPAADSIVAMKQGYRAYVSVEGGVHSLVSRDGVSWKSEEGVRVSGGRDATVVQLDDGTFLMLYCTIGEAAPNGLGSVATKPSMGPMGEAGQAVIQRVESRPRTDGDGESSANRSSGPDSGEQDGFAPLGDLKNSVDYISWLEQNVVVPPDQNAFSSYAGLLESLEHRPDGLFNDMFNDTFNGRRIHGSPGSWNPADHPEWEASYQATQESVDQFRLATQDPRPYSSPFSWSPDISPEDRLLVNVLLPGLTGYRAMTRAVLSQAWRTEDGSVPPEQMRDAFRICLGNVNHLQQASTVIERLIGNDERLLVEENARWALRQGVFLTSAELETTLNVLRERDLPDPDLDGCMRTHCAQALDAIQYLFAPENAGDEPRLRVDRAEKLVSQTMGDLDDPEREKLLKLTAEDAKVAMEFVDDYFRVASEAWKGGYRALKAANPDRMAEEMHEKNVLGPMFVPSFMRVNTLLARGEASRRATQLTYEVHLFKARNGRWPASLDELPADHDETIKTDPFTDGQFGYRLTEAGPKIYSSGEDGQDNGGAHAGNWIAGKDYVFWPPQK